MKRIFLLLSIVAAMLTANAYEVGDWFIEEGTGRPVMVIYGASFLLSFSWFSAMRTIGYPYHTQWIPIG